MRCANRLAQAATVRPSFFLDPLSAIVAAIRKTKDSVRKYRIDDQPDRGESNNAIRDDRTNAPVAHKDRRHQVEIEKAVQSPIDRTQQDQNIGNQIRYDHNALPPFISLPRHSAFYNG